MEGERGRDGRGPEREVEGQRKGKSKGARVTGGLMKGAEGGGMETTFRGEHIKKGVCVCGETNKRSVRVWQRSMWRVRDWM